MVIIPSYIGKKSVELTCTITVWYLSLCNSITDNRHKVIIKLNTEYDMEVKNVYIQILVNIVIKDTIHIEHYMQQQCKSWNNSLLERYGQTDLALQLNITHTHTHTHTCVYINWLSIYMCLNIICFMGYIRFRDCILHIFALMKWTMHLAVKKGSLLILIYVMWYPLKLMKSYNVIYNFKGWWIFKSTKQNGNVSHFLPLIYGHEYQTQKLWW